ncbi:hypothetical protein BV898_01579 [Hypsibius exemplaris]|uniref:Uncharacterized protein n=1 Tax=Hypsibius exemplaris TaxID=2072580 RepID=A0A1W0XAG6_HYPEX|nr:hypothetical protein BV898_01579 [Hypsibius exemplaris]
MEDCDIDLKPEGVSAASSTPMDVSIVPRSDVWTQYSLSKQRGLSAARQTGLLFLELMKTPEMLSDCLQEDIESFTNALLDRNNVDILYLQILASMPNTSLQSLIVQLARLHSTPQNVETQSALLFSLSKVLPAAVESDQVAALLMETSRTLLGEAAHLFSPYPNPYREAVAVKFLPLLLSRRKQSETLRQFYLEILPAVTKFFVGAVLHSLPDTDAVCLTPEEVWDSLNEILTEVSCLLSSEGQHSPRKSATWKQSHPFWNTRCPSVHELVIWWANFQTATAKLSPSESQIQLNFCYRLAFWGFLLYWYTATKNESQMPERRPYLLQITVPDGADPGSLPKPTAQSRLRSALGEKLEKIFTLTREVWLTLTDVKTLRAIDSIVNDLQLDSSSAAYITFRLDLAAITDDHSLSSYHADLHPRWVKIQLIVTNLSIRIRKDGLNAAVFPEMVAVFSQLNRTAWSFGDRKPAGTSLVYVWDDVEVSEHLCGVLVDAMLKQPLDRASDEFLSALLVFIQPLLPALITILKGIVGVIGSRDKFVFKRFFAYIVSVDVMAEVGQALATGTVVMDLTTEPLTGAASVHKTRGANRGTTDALLVELQRHVANLPAVPFKSSACQAVMAFVSNEKDNLARVIFQQASGLSSRRGRGTVA